MEASTYAETPCRSCPRGHAKAGVEGSSHMKENGDRLGALPPPSAVQSPHPRNGPLGVSAYGAARFGRRAGPGSHWKARLSEVHRYTRRYP
jgi:hypothetical protein